MVFSPLNLSVSNDGSWKITPESVQVELTKDRRTIWSESRLVKEKEKLVEMILNGNNYKKWV